MKLLSLDVKTSGAVIIAEGVMELSPHTALLILNRPGQLADPIPTIRGYFLDEFPKVAGDKFPRNVDILEAVFALEKYTGLTVWSFSLIAVRRFQDATETDLKTLSAKEVDTQKEK